MLRIPGPSWYEFLVVVFCVFAELHSGMGGISICFYLLGGFRPRCQEVHLIYLQMV